MKTLLPAMTLVIITLSLATSCNSPHQKVINAEQELINANKSLATMQQEKRAESKSQDMQNELGQYLADCELVISANEKQIAMIEKAILFDKSGINRSYVIRVNELTYENKLLKKSIIKNQTKTDTSWDAILAQIKNDTNLSN